MGEDRATAAARADRLRHWDRAPRPLITPSVLSCDFSRVAEELDALKAAGTAAVHVDVMDAHFVPNLSFGPPVIAKWRQVTDFPFDTHLMMSDPARYVEAFAHAGCDLILFHIEVVADPVPLARRIRELGCRAGIVLNPPTPLATIEPYVDAFDVVLVMSVMPGFGGQLFEPAVLSKVRALRSAHPALAISIDGGITPETAAIAVEAGATQLVAGASVFRSDGNYAAALAELAEGAHRGLTRGGGPAHAAV